MIQCLPLSTFFLDGFFEPEHKSAELAFKWTMQKINLHNDILSQVLVAYIVKEVPPDDSFDVSKKGGVTLPVMSSSCLYFRSYWEMMTG